MLCSPYYSSLVSLKNDSRREWLYRIQDALRNSLTIICGLPPPLELTAFDSASIPLKVSHNPFFSSLPTSY